MEDNGSFYSSSSRCLRRLCLFVRLSFASRGSGPSTPPPFLILRAISRPSLARRLCVWESTHRFATPLSPPPPRTLPPPPLSPPSHFATCCLLSLFLSSRFLSFFPHRLAHAPHRVYAVLQIRTNHPLARTRVRPHMHILTSRPTSALFSHLHRLNVSSWSLAKVKCG